MLGEGREAVRMDLSFERVQWNVWVQKRDAGTAFRVNTGHEGSDWEICSFWGDKGQKGGCKITK